MSRHRPGYGFNGGPGARSSLRNLRHLCAPLLAQRDAAALIALSRVTVFASGAQWPEHAALVLVNQAREIEASTGTPWPQALDGLVDYGERQRSKIKPQPIVDGEDGPTA